MRSWRFHAFGSIDNLRVDEIPLPEPGPGEARVKVAYAALNPADRFLIEGKYPRPGTPPFAVGRDGCGTIDKPAAGGRFKAGEKVIVLRSEIGVTREGTLAEYVCVPETSLASQPAGWSDEESAGAALTHLTAWMALVEDGALELGETVLVTGASGGVGTAAVVLAKALGAKVVALSRSEAKRARLLELGADFALDSEAPQLAKTVRDALGGGRCDVIVENLAGDYLQQCMDLANYRARICVVGLLAGFESKIQIGTLIHKRLAIKGTAVAGYTAEASQAAWAQIVAKLDKAGRRPEVDQVFPFEKLLEAFARLKEGPMGKVLVGPMHP